MRAEKKEELKSLGLGEPGDLRIHKCCQTLLSRLLEIQERVDQASKN